MTLKARARLIIFVAYVVLFFTLPLALLWGSSGFVVGLAAALFVLTGMRLGATEKILQRLKARHLTRAEAFAPYHVAEELCRRLKLPVPRLAIVESPALNAAVLGFSRNHYVIVLTRGLLETLGRGELSALMSRLLVSVPDGMTFTATWLAQFLNIMEWASNPSRGRPSGAPRRFYSFRLVFRQVLLYPLAMVPSILLRNSSPPEKLDDAAVGLCLNPRALSEVLRRLDATRDRVPLIVSFSYRHLFVLAPPATDVLARVLFEPDRLGDRIREFAKFRKVVTVS